VNTARAFVWLAESRAPTTGSVGHVGMSPRLRIGQNVGMPSEAAWFGLVGALGGVSLTGIIGAGTAALTHRWTTSSSREQRESERAVALADRRLTMYTQYFSRAKAFREAVEDAYDDPEWVESIIPLTGERRLKAFRARAAEVVQEFDTASTQAELVATEQARQALKAFEDWVTSELVRITRISDPRVESIRFVGAVQAGAALVEATRRDVQEDGAL
jgi:hypothetical protein